MADFYTVLESYNAPPLFAKWGAAYVIGAAVSRRVWMLSYDEHIYPNFYVLLIGPSGAGKGVVLNPITEVLKRVPHQVIAPASLTAAAIADELEDSHHASISDSGEAFEYNALTVISREFGVFLPTYDSVMLNLLTDVYDNKGYSERRRGNKRRLEIPEAHLSIIGGTTPAWMNNVLPEGAWSEGFMSRVISVFSGTSERREIVESLGTRRIDHFDELGDRLAKIAERSGRIIWEPAALTMFNRWFLDGAKPEPTHPKLISYLQRRHYNLWKLCLVFCLSRGGTAISTNDFECALDMLLETEAVMPEIFKAMKTGGDQSAIEEAWHYMFKRFMVTKQPIPKHYLIRFLQGKVPSYSVAKIIEVMVGADLLRLHMINKVGECYEPLRPHED